MEFSAYQQMMFWFVVTASVITATILIWWSMGRD